MSRRYDFSAQRSFTPYPKEVLPEGFRYPQGYLEHSRDMLYPVQFPWGFIDHNEHGLMEWEFRSFDQEKGEIAPREIDPIPFARNGELAAYFDGKDHSGDPPVFVVHLPDGVCIERFDNFDAWLQAGKEDGGIGDPPYDRVSATPSYLVAADVLDGYYICPNCYDANRPLRAYDTAILCPSCETYFNLG